MTRLVVAIVAGALAAGCGGGDGGGGDNGGGSAGVSAAAMEAQIRGPLQRQLRRNLDDSSITVEALDCVKKSSSDGSCFAKVSDSTGYSTNLSIKVDIDPDTGDVIWRVES